MATLNYTKGSGYSVSQLNKFFVLHNVVDFSKTPSGAGDTVQVLNIPAGTLVLHAGHKTVTAEGATASGTFGDGADPNGFIEASDFNAAATQISTLLLTEGTPNTATGYMEGKFYASADTIDAVTTEALDAAKVDFFAVCVDCN